MIRTRGVRLAAALVAGLVWSSSAAAEPGRQAQTGVSDSSARPIRVSVEELQQAPGQYIGQTVTVDASVDEVWGPRVFTVNEPRWGDLDGELMVFMPTVLAAGVREREHVTITGTLKPFVKVEFAREWGWQSLTSDAEEDLAATPILVASRVEARNRIVQVALTPPRPTPPNNIPSSPVSTSETGTARADVTLTDASRVAVSTEALVGRTVNLQGLGVSGVTSQGGFVVNAGLGQLFVLSVGSAQPRIGDRVDLQGLLLRMPPAMRSHIDGPARMNRDIYIFATAVAPR